MLEGQAELGQRGRVVGGGGEVVQGGDVGVGAPAVRGGQQHLLRAVDGLAPGGLAGVQLRGLGPGLDVGGGVLQQHGDGGDGVLGAAQALEDGDAALADADVGGVLAQHLLVAVEDLLQVLRGPGEGLVVDAAHGEDALVALAEARLEPLKDLRRGRLVAGAQRGQQQVLVDGP